MAEAALVFDLLCIHPFRDGNGRVARLLTLLTLLTLRKQGFHVGAYVSLERLMEARREEYYDALARSSVGWHHQGHDLLPWRWFLLSVVREAYSEMAERFGRVEATGGKMALIECTVLEKHGPFTLAQLSAQLPSVSSAAIKKVLAALRRRGALELSGRGRGARWRRRPGVG